MADEVKVEEYLEADLRQDVAKVKIGGVVHDLVIIEMTGDAEEEYLDNDKDNIKLDVNEDGSVKARLVNVKGVHKALLAKMIWENGSLVPVETIGKWPTRVQRALYVKAQAVMGYRATTNKTQDKVDELKNE